VAGSAHVVDQHMQTKGAESVGADPNVGISIGSDEINTALSYLNEISLLMYAERKFSTLGSIHDEIADM
jgi:hypothetical protein